jgi:hypothetical protein
LYRPKVASLASLHFTVPTSEDWGNEDDEAPPESAPPLDSLPPLGDDDEEAPLDSGWVQLTPPLDDEDDPTPLDGFVPAISKAEDVDVDSERLPPLSALELIAPLENEPLDTEERPFDTFEPIVVESPKTAFEDDDEGPAFEPFVMEAATTGLPCVPGFELDWQDREPTRQLLPLGQGFFAIGARCRHYALKGEVLLQCNLPAGFVRAAVTRQSAWVHASQRLSAVDNGFEMLCIAGGKIFVRAGNDWFEPTEEDASLEVDAQRLVQRGDDVLIGSRDGRWFSLEDGHLRPAFGGRKLRALCAASSWIGLAEEQGRLLLMALEGEAARLLSPNPVPDHVRLYAFGKTIVIERLGEGLWGCSLPAPLELIPGSRGYRGVCLGEGNSVALWTTLEMGEALALVEVDVETWRSTWVATLPWRVTDDDAPTIHDMLWLADAKRLLIASDQGVVCLRRVDAPKAEAAPTSERPS